MAIKQISKAFKGLSVPKWGILTKRREYTYDTDMGREWKSFFYRVLMP